MEPLARHTGTWPTHRADVHGQRTWELNPLEIARGGLDG